MSTSNQNKEIETRIVVPDNKIKETQNILESLGFKLIEKFIQKDIILDKPDASLFKSGQKIRIREEKGVAELTYKGLFEGSQDFARRSEINIPLNPDNIENMKIIFASLGYPLLFQIIKERTVYKKDGIKATYDNWPIIGTMLEIEGGESEVKKVTDVFSSDFEFKNYRLKDLLSNRVSESGKSFADLKSYYEKLAGNKLGQIELIFE